jgi:hypothetical protein
MGRRDWLVWDDASVIVDKVSTLGMRGGGLKGFFFLTF